jgi:hypothetical protein
VRFQSYSSYLARGPGGLAAALHSSRAWQGRATRLDGAALASRRDRDAGELLGSELLDGHGRGRWKHSGWKRKRKQCFQRQVLPPTKRSDPGGSGSGSGSSASTPRVLPRRRRPPPIRSSTSPGRERERRETKGYRAIGQPGAVRHGEGHEGHEGHSAANAGELSEPLSAISVDSACKTSFTPFTPFTLSGSQAC